MRIITYIVKKKPSNPHTTRAVGADREGAPGQSEGERGRRESRRRDGGWNELNQNRKGI
jgi:hypothetical protein